MDSFRQVQPALRYNFRRGCQGMVLRAKAPFGLLLALLLVVSLVLPAAPVYAQELPATDSPLPTDKTEGLAGLVLHPEESGTRLILSSPIGASTAETLALAGSIQRYQGYDLPMQTVVLRIPGPEYVQALQILGVNAVDLPADAVQPGPPDDLGLLPVDAAAAAAAGESFTENDGAPIALAIQPDPELPVAPVFVLRSGQMNGEWVVVLAVSPLYQESGSTRFATHIEAFFPGAQPSGDNLIAESEAETAALTGEESVLAAASPDLAEACAAYTLPLNDSGERILRVSNPGLQVVPRSALGPLSALPANQLSLSLNGMPVAVQISGGNLIFYANSVGDRWNPTDAYVLRPSSTQFPARIMAGAQTVSALSGGGVSVVIDRGITRNNTLYSSLWRGFDGDHWSAGDIWINATGRGGKPSGTLNVVLNNAALNTPPNKLPPSTGATTLAFNVSPYKAVNSSPRQYNLAVKIGNSTTTVAFPEFALPWPDGLSGTVTVATNPSSLTLSLSQVLTYSSESGLLIDSVAYARPVTLALAQNGAVFEGNSGQNQYRWSGAASGFLLYDVTDPSAPIPLTGASASGFTDGRGAAKRYLVTGEGFLHTPAVEVKNLQEYKNLTGVQAIYITANGDFANALKPLTDHRCKSYKVAVVDVKAIYNRYSNSQVSADAIRNFLRDAWYSSEVGNPGFNYFTWKPLSVVMVGDATYDPWNYSKKTGKNYNLLPAFMHEDIDPFIGEAACDNCYGQLNGEDPHTGDGTLFTMEIYVGRIPANTAGEVADASYKIVRYETQGSDLDPWRGSTLLFADNYWRHDGNGGFYRDPAGDFAKTSDEVRSIAIDGRGEGLTSRVYYDPAPQLNVTSAVNDWWRSNTRTALKTDVMRALNSKPALIIYNGHANTFHMGSTESPAGDTTREYVLMFQDVGALTNSNELFLLLSMTCQTSQFVVPTDGGRTIDEFYLLSPASGAFATWGSTGQSAVAGHEVLQDGFLTQLFGKTAPQTLGVLLRAGYENVLRKDVRNVDVLRTFMLMGDPLTKYRFNSQPNTIFVPKVANK